MSDYNSGAIISGGLNGEGTRAGESFATEIWGPVVETKMKEKLVLSPLFNDLSSFVATQGERIHLPKIGQVTAGTKGEAAITFEASSSDQSEEILNIDQHKFAAVVVDDIVQVQGNYDLTQLFSAELGYALAKGVDEYLDGKIIDSFNFWLPFVTINDIRVEQGGDYNVGTNSINVYVEFSLNNDQRTLESVQESIGE